MDENTINICTLVPVVIEDELDDDASETATDLGGVFDDSVDGGGELPLGFIALGLLSPADLADALEQIAGEVGTGVAPTGTQAMDSFLDIVSNSMDDDVAGPDNAPGDSSAPGEGTVRVLGYASGDPAAAHPGLAAFDQPGGGVTLDPRNWKMWAAAFGGYGNTDGDPMAGKHDRSSNNYGLAAGLNLRVTPDTKIGVAISGGRTSFDLSDDFGSGNSNMIQVAAYARTNIDAAYIAAALAYGYHDETTDRTILIGGPSRFTAAFTAHDLAGQVEVGYHLGPITPYAAVRVQSFYTPAYSETTVSGPSTFALDYEENTTDATRTELGARVAQTVALHKDADLT
jgi:uncharacterized protein with beta-barrel porin domain